MANTKGRIFAACNGSRWGLITERGTWFISPEFTALQFPQEGIFPARIDGSSAWTLHSISEPQAVVAQLTPAVDRVGLPGSGLRAFQSANGKWGFFDLTGVQRVEPRFVRATPGSQSDVLRFQNGQACVGYEIASRHGGVGSVLGLIDDSGKTLAEPSYQFIAYGEGSFVIEPDENTEQEPPFGFDVRALGVAGGPECRVSFRDADILRAFRFGYAPFGVDPANRKARVEETYFPQLADVSQVRWGLVDYSGNVQTPAIHEEVRPYSEKLAPFRKGGLWGFLNEDGEVAIPPSFREVEFFSEGVAACQNHDSRWGIIDCNGEWAVAPNFDKISSEFASYS